MTTPKFLTSLAARAPQADLHPPLPPHEPGSDDVAASPAHGRLRVRLTLEGDPYALRYQAKGGGYTYEGRSWHREISTPLLGGSALELGRSDAALRELVREEAARFDCRTSITEPTVR